MPLQALRWSFFVGVNRCTMRFMHGDSLTWVLFWFGILAEILINLATGLLLSIVFVTLQIQRDLLDKLDEIWILSNHAFNEIWTLRSTEQRADRRIALPAKRLSDLWERSRRTLKFALTDAQWNRLLNGITSILELQELYANKKYEPYWQQHEMNIADEKGMITPTMVDYGHWANDRKLKDEVEAYYAVKERESLAFKQINALLFFDADEMEKHGDPNKALPLPAELERAWNFAYLFPRAWKWFLSEFFGGFWREYKRSHEQKSDSRRE
jgi:hypothetical protein